RSAPTVVRPQPLACSESRSSATLRSAKPEAWLTRRSTRRPCRFSINAVHAEKQATRAQGRAVAAAIDELGGFLGARTIRYGRRRPAMWKL
ncbi:MAG TPA: hypothetical protein VL172_13875, partial [Kofleriaceae bacterium]|nr:hypothetical protein [Kofleriaceae bacterium]